MCSRPARLPEHADHIAYGLLPEQLFAGTVPEGERNRCGSISSMRPRIPALRINKFAFIKVRTPCRDNTQSVGKWMFAIKQMIHTRHAHFQKPAENLHSK
jgi:hypothetical protein